MKLKVTLDSAVNALLGLTCIVILGFAVQRFVPGQQSPAMARDAYAIGETLEGIAFGANAAPQTAVAFIHSSCRYCAASMAFYKTLVASAAHTSRKFRFVVVGIEDSETLQRFVADFGLTPDDIVSVPVANVRVRATPTLVVVDRHGVVRRSWTGQQSKAEEARIQAVVAENVSGGL